MRFAVAAAFGAITLVATTSIATAASLFGSPFLIRDAPDDRFAFVYAFDDGDGAFAVLYSNASDAGRLPSNVSVVRFDAAGNRRGSRIEIFDGRAKPDDFQASGSGWFPLEDKTALVAVSTPRTKGDAEADTGLLGQVVGRSKLIGNRFSIDMSSPNVFANGGIYRLNSGRGLAIWSSAYQVDGAEFARFIAPDGTPSRRRINLTDRQNRLYGIKKHRDGFIAHYWHETENAFSSSFQVYDSSGEKVGDRKTFPDINGGFPAVFGLANGPILAAQMDHYELSSSLAVQTFDDRWGEIKKRQVILKNLKDPWNVEALEDGGFLVGVMPRHEGSGDLIDLVRYTASFKKVGAPVRISVERGRVHQILSLRNGRALVIYRNNGTFMGQLITP